MLNERLGLILCVILRDVLNEGLDVIVPVKVLLEDASGKMR